MSARDPLTPASAGAMASREARIAPGRESDERASVLRHAVVDGQTVVPGRRAPERALPSIQGGAKGPVTIDRSEPSAAASRQHMHGAVQDMSNVATKASTDASAAEQAAFERGRAEGLAQGRSQAERQLREWSTRMEQELDARTEKNRAELTQQMRQAYQSRLQKLDEWMAALSAQIDGRLAEAEDDVLSLCVDTVARVLGDNALRPDAIRSHLSRALAELRSQTVTAIHLHPQDLALLRQDPDALPEALGHPALEWIASSDVPLGGCILQSAEGALDARLETQMSAFIELVQRARLSAAAPMGQIDGGRA